jgi:hypothetical protein
MRALGLALALSTVAALGACQSTRFGGPQVAAARTGPAYNAPVVEPGVGVPASAVTSAPLPPLGPSEFPDPGSPVGPGPAVSDVPVMPGGPRPIETLGAPAPQVAVATPSRSNVLGGWTAREASGSCRVQLASSPALDLYKASASGCSNRDLARITAWDFRDGEVFLYQPGGAVAARLRPGPGALEGVLAKSGAPLTLTR